MHSSDLTYEPNPALCRKPYTLIIEKNLIKKPNLGGWRDRKSGVEYRNGDSQTGPAPKRVPWEKTCSRKVQTSVQVDRACQSTYSQATQMWRRDCYVAGVSDDYVAARAYETFEEARARLDLDSRARVIQRCYRAYRFLGYVRECARVYRELQAECDRIQELKYSVRRDRREAECRALNDQSTPLGLSHLLHRLKTDAEEDESNCPEKDRHTRALRLLEARQRVFLSNSRKKRAAREARAQRSRARFLARQCEPKRWLDRRDRVVEMLTLRNQVAIECRDLYEKLLQDPNAGRMELLVKTKSSVEKHHCREANALRDLIDQEIALTSKDVGAADLGFLRKRVVGVFLNFLRYSHNCTCRSVQDECRVERCDYEFRESLEKSQIFCASCCRLRPRGEFPVTSRRQSFNKCLGCVRLRDNSSMPLDMGPFARLLSAIRTAEPEGLADAISVPDLRHLVLTIWHGHSVLSESSELGDLRLPRYELDQPWSPWNCVLLTEDEAEAHCCVGGGGGYYSDHLKRKIRSAHRVARMDFRGLIVFEGRVDLKKKNDGTSGAKEDVSTTIEPAKTMSNTIIP